MEPTGVRRVDGTLQQHSGDEEDHLQAESFSSSPRRSANSNRMSPNIWILDDGSKASHCAVRPMEDETAKNWELAGAVCADELANTMKMEKVRFQGMGTHFSIPRMNERNCKKIEE